MGNYSIDQRFWGRPEDITGPRPYYAAPVNVSGKNSSVDLGGSVAAALLAAYVANPTAPNAEAYLSTGENFAFKDPCSTRRSARHLKYQEKCWAFEVLSCAPTVWPIRSSCPCRLATV